MNVCLNKSVMLGYTWGDSVITSNLLGGRIFGGFVSKGTSNANGFAFVKLPPAKLRQYFNQL